MTFTSKLFCCFLFAALLAIPSNVFAQNLDSPKLTDQFKQLLYQKEHDSVLTLAKYYLEPLKVTNSKDSLFRAKLKLFEHSALQGIEDNYDVLASLENLIRLCPQSQSGDSLKAVLYNKKGYFEAESVSTMASFKSIATSIKLLENLPNPSVGYLMGGNKPSLNFNLKNTAIITASITGFDLIYDYAKAQKWLPFSNNG